jgi:hypothetical protein
VGHLSFPDVDPGFDVMPKRLFGPFWSLRILDRTTGEVIPITGGAFLTGYGSVHRAAKHSTHLYLVVEKASAPEGSPVSYGR